MAKFFNSKVRAKVTNVGFKKSSMFVPALTQKGFEKRGFAQYKLLTNWKEVIGIELYQISKPVKVSFPKNGLGAILTIEINGSFGPELDMQKEIIKEKVNRLYGYTAVVKIKFKSSSTLGYDRSKKVKFFSSLNQNKQEDREASPQDVINFVQSLSLCDVTDQSLRETLHEMSNNFIKRIKSNNCPVKE